MKDIWQLREDIDTIDEQLLALLAERFQKSDAVAEYKKKHKKPVLDPSREKELFAALEQKAKEYHLPPAAIISIFKEVLHQSRRLQEQKINSSLL